MPSSSPLPWASAPAVLADWRRFGARTYRNYHLLALCQGMVILRVDGLG
jgi:hypothetical protein